MRLIPTILCGGAGSRLWPVSRELHPKPFIRLEDGLSLLQKAFLRGANLPEVTEILTVTNSEFFFKISEEFNKVNQKKLKTSFILEPFGKNTAPAIATAALRVQQIYGDDAQILILAADHLIADQEAFVEAVMAASKLAADGKLVTFGIKPSEPNTGYGYIEAEQNTVIKFVEKPNRLDAQAYVESQRFLWNSGMFLFRVRDIINELKLFSPNILGSVQACIKVSTDLTENSSSKLILEPDTFANTPDDSIDYAVMEKSKNVAVVPCDIGWSDVGSWQVLGDLISPDNNGNRIDADTCLYDVSNCFIQSKERLIGAVGVENLLIIDTPDALLVANKDRAQDVKHIYSKLKHSDHETHKLHRTVFRPWGSYTILEESKNFKIKRIVVKPGASLSLQMHHHRSEHWIVVSGMAKVTNDTDVFFVGTNESTYIPAGHKHRLENPGILDLVMIEVQSGEYLGEDDIIRFEDIYGRTEELVK